jgi:hypothetical protein
MTSSVMVFGANWRIQTAACSSLYPEGQSRVNGGYGPRGQKWRFRAANPNRITKARKNDNTTEEKGDLEPQTVGFVPSLFCVFSLSCFVLDLPLGKNASNVTALSKAI